MFSLVQKTTKQSRLHPHGAATAVGTSCKSHSIGKKRKSDDPATNFSFFLWIVTLVQGSAIQWNLPHSLSDERNRKWRVCTEKQKASKIKFDSDSMSGIDRRRCILHNDSLHNRRRILYAIIKVAAKYEVSLFFRFRFSHYCLILSLKSICFSPRRFACFWFAVALFHPHAIKIPNRQQLNGKTLWIFPLWISIGVNNAPRCLTWHDCWLVKQKQVRRSLLIRCTTCTRCKSTQTHTQTHEATVKMTKNNCRTRVASEVRSMFDRLFKRN